MKFINRATRFTLILTLLFYSIKGFAQCPTEAQLEAGGTLNIPTDNDCSSAVSCTLTTANFWDISGDITLESCVTLNLNQGTSFISIVGGTFTVNEGATLTTNKRVVVNGATLIVNGTMDIGDGAGTDNLAVTGGGSIIVGATGSVDVGNGFVRVGSNTANSGTMTVNGSLTTSGDVNIRNGGELAGSGQITFGGSFLNSGTSTDVFTSCSGSNTSCGASTLPVKLLSFQTKVINRDRAYISWETASEINNEGFFIEKSGDGEYFEVIGFVEGHGTTDAYHAYQFYDDRLTSNSYYRLRQVDFDGQFDYSNLSFLEWQEGQNNAVPMGIYPNPVVDSFSFSNAKEGVFDWSLFNVKGEQLALFRNLSVAQAETQFNQLITNLDTGNYFIKMGNRDIQQSIRMLKQ